MLFNCVKILFLGLRILILSHTWLIEMQFLILLIFVMKKFRKCITLIEINDNDKR
jgi:hypothetical protein